MINLLLTILCSTAIALLLKLNETRKGEPLLFLAGNYLAASILGAIFFFNNGESQFEYEPILFGAGVAILFVMSFFAFAKGVKIAGTALATVSSRLSVVIPIVLAVIFFGEIPQTKHYFGFFLTIITLLFFYRSLKQAGGKAISFSDYLYLAILFLGIGFGDFTLKIFQSVRPVCEKPLFLWSIFSFSFLYCSVLILIKRIELRRDTFLRGMVLGIPNIFTSYFLIESLMQLSAIIVYPVVNIGIILLTAVLANIFWKERINGFGKLALLAGTTAIIILSI